MMMMEDEALIIISRVLSYTVVGMSVILKFPQVIAIVKERNTDGINLKAYWMEIAAYLIGFFYGYSHDYHISVYVESGLLAFQSAVIIFLVIWYDSSWTVENAIYAILGTSFIVTSLFRLVPHSLLSVLLSLTLPLAAGSKLAQIRAIYEIKSRGNVSILTWSLATYGCFARLFTIVVEVGDLLILFNFFVSAVLNSIVVMMCVYYGDNKKKI